MSGSEVACSGLLIGMETQMQMDRATEGGYAHGEKRTGATYKDFAISSSRPGAVRFSSAAAAATLTTLRSARDDDDGLD